MQGGAAAAEDRPRSRSEEEGEEEKKKRRRRVVTSGLAALVRTGGWDRGRRRPALAPARPPLLGSLTFAISHVACGGAQAIALTDDEEVNVVNMVMGTWKIAQRQPVKFMKCFTICPVSAGWNHSGYVTDTGHLFTCGDGSFGRLGHGNRQLYISLKWHSLPLGISCKLYVDYDIPLP